jgi:hypothetical protein
VMLYGFCCNARLLEGRETHLLVENGLCLTTETHLLAIVSSLALCLRKMINDIWEWMRNDVWKMYSIRIRL